MQITPVALIEGVALTVSNAIYYTTPLSAIGSGIGDITILNTSSNDITVSLYVVPNGQSAAVSNAILYNYAIPAGMPPQNFSMRKFMNPGTSIVASASTGSVVALSVSGVVVTP